MNKNSGDAVSTLMERLGLEDSENSMDPEEALRKAFGEKEGAALAEHLYQFRPKKEEEFIRQHAAREYYYEDTGYYSFRYQSPKLAVVLDSCTEKASLGEIGRWLTSHQDLFGKTVLEIGCGDGFFCLLLGLLFPERRILGIDRTENAVKTASALRDQLGLSNVSFETMDIRQMEEGRTFDTVLSIRTMQENTKLNPDTVLFGPFSRQIQDSKENLREYTDPVAAHVRDSGTLVMIEYEEESRTYGLGLLENLNEKGLGPDFSLYQSIPLSPSGAYFQGPVRVIVSKKGAPLSEKDLFRGWRHDAFRKTSDPEQFTKAQADRFVERYSDGVLYGFNTYETLYGLRQQAGRHVLYGYRGNPDRFLLYMQSGATLTFRVVPRSEYDSCEAALENTFRAGKKDGLIMEPIPEGAAY